MLRHVLPDHVLATSTYLRLAQECIKSRDISLARSFEQHLQRTGQELHLFLGNLLINMYAKSGGLTEAQDILQNMASKDVVSWTSLISGYAENGDFEKAFHLFSDMQQHGHLPNTHTFGSLLKSCSGSPQAVQTSGRRLHQLLHDSGAFQGDVYVSTALLSMYGSCGYIGQAGEIFRAMNERNVVTWSAMLSSYVVAIESSGSSSASASLVSSWREDAISLFRALMSEGGIRPDKVMFISLLGICSKVADAELFHRCIAEAGLTGDSTICHALIVTYARSGSFDHAWSVFRGMKAQDVIAWTSMIKAASISHEPYKSLSFFKQMLLEGIVPTKRTLAEALNSCLEASPLPIGRSIHACSLELGYIDHEPDVVLQTALLNMYGRCGALAESERLFRSMPSKNIVSWTSMITAYAEAGRCHQALGLFRCMQLEGVCPNRVGFIAVLTACASPEFLRQGRLVHGLVTEKGLEADPMVANALVSMYGRCGSLSDAKTAFGLIRRPDVVSWSAFLAAYAQDERLDPRTRSREALLTYRRMQLEGVMPRKVTLVSVLSCCCDIAAGEQIHSRSRSIHDPGVSDVVLGNAVVYMYVRCGALQAAGEAFRRMEVKDLVSWNGMITASAQHGRVSEALEYLREMQLEGVKGDGISMVGVIFACSHKGLVEQGCRYFADMNRDYGVDPKTEHYACVVDMLGRAGHLEDGEEFLRACPGEAAVDPVLWTTMLASCRVHGDAPRGKDASEQILSRNPGNTSVYVVLSQLPTC